CHWDSKETSHAKFWRTVSELAELKGFVPRCESLCVFFGASDGYKAEGWYPELLRALHLLSDLAVFASVPTLEADLQRLRERLPPQAGTAAVHRAIAERPGDHPAVAALEALIPAARHPSPPLRPAVRAPRRGGARRAARRGRALRRRPRDDAPGPPGRAHPRRVAAGGSADAAVRLAGARRPAPPGAAARRLERAVPRARPDGRLDVAPAGAA